MIHGVPMKQANGAVTLPPDVDLLEKFVTGAKGFVRELVFDEDSWQGLYSVPPRVIADYLLEHRQGAFRGLYGDLAASVCDRQEDFDAALAAAHTVVVGAVDVSVVPVEDALERVGHDRLVERFRELTRG